MRVNQIVNVLVKKIQIVKKVKTIEMKTAQKTKIVEKLKTIEIHLHSMKWELVYDDNRREQLDRESSSISDLWRLFSLSRRFSTPFECSRGDEKII